MSSSRTARGKRRAQEEPEDVKPKKLKIVVRPGSIEFTPGLEIVQEIEGKSRTPTS